MVLLAILQKSGEKWNFTVNEKNMVVPDNERPWVVLPSLLVTYLQPIGTDVKVMKSRMIVAFQLESLAEQTKLKILNQELYAFDNN